MDKDSQDVHQELAKLKAKIQEAREQISNMPGIDSSPVDQQQQLATLTEQVRTKNQLLQKYKSLCMFDVPKPSWRWKLEYCTKRKKLRDSRGAGRTYCFHYNLWSSDSVIWKGHRLTFLSWIAVKDVLFCAMRMQTRFCGICIKHYCLVIFLPCNVVIL